MSTKIDPVTEKFNEIDRTTERLNEVIDLAQRKVTNGLRFHMRAWVSNFDALKKHSRKVVLDWAEFEAKQLDQRLEKVCWTLHRPVSWLTEKINLLDDERLKIVEKSRKADQEKKLQDMEVPRLVDEGGPAA